MDDLYAAWNEVCLNVDIRGQWKRNPTTVGMLEHVSKAFAETYLDLCLAAGVPLEVIQAYARRVDAIGRAQVEIFRRDRVLVASCTCLRYFWHALEIVEFASDDIVELGGGYGGLVVAIAAVREFLGIQTPLKYTIIDLPGPNCLQSKYIACFPLGDIDVHIQDGRDFGSTIERPISLISHYCLAEMGETNRQQYIATLMPNVVKGCFQWNSEASIDFLADYNVQIFDENPKTGPNNKTIKFEMK
jgi:hypothetical protein